MCFWPGQYGDFSKRLKGPSKCTCLIYKNSYFKIIYEKFFREPTMILLCLCSKAASLLSASHIVSVLLESKRNDPLQWVEEGLWFGTVAPNSMKWPFLLSRAEGIVVSQQGLMGSLVEMERWNPTRQRNWEKKSQLISQYPYLESIVQREMGQCRTGLCERMTVWAGLSAGGVWIVRLSLSLCENGLVILKSQPRICLGEFAKSLSFYQEHCYSDAVLLSRKLSDYTVVFFCP